MVRNEYHFLRTVVNKIHELQKHTDLILEKAEKGNIGTYDALDVVGENATAEGEYCTFIQQQFESLKEDYEKGVINQAVYKKYLNDLNHLLTGGSKKVDNTRLDVKGMIKEIQTYLSEYDGPL